MIYTYFAPRGGWRLVVLFHRGRKWVRLLDTATLDVYTESHAELRHLRPAGARPKALAKRLVRRRADWRRYGFRFSRCAVQAAIRLLRQAPARAS